MAGRAWTEEEQEKLRALWVVEGLTAHECASQMERRSLAAVKNKLQMSGWAQGDSSGTSMPSESFTRSDDGDKSTIVSVDRKIKTVDDALKYGEVDRKLWEVERSTVNSWEVSMKKPDGSAMVVPLWQVKVHLRRKAPKFVQEGILELCKELSRYKSPTLKRPKVIRDPHLAEFSVFDAHFGKLCWGEETGEDYDTKIAELVYEHAVEDMAAKVAGYNVEKIWYPVGSDFFQVNNWAHTTAKGTPQDHDGRFQKVFQVGTKAIIRNLEMLEQIAPVEVFYVPGNHDPATSWYLCAALEERYHDSKWITVDNSSRPRKCQTYGCCMVLFTHGDEEPHRDLPTIAATEYPKEWAASTVREAHVGHYHKKKEMRTVDVDEFQGFRVRILPSLSGTDKWHFSRGYVGGHRAAEVYLWSKANGYGGHFNVNVREAA